MRCLEMLMRKITFLYIYIFLLLNNTKQCTDEKMHMYTKMGVIVLVVFLVFFTDPCKFEDVKFCIFWEGNINTGF